MRWVPRSFPVEIHRELNVADLADVSEQQLEQADEEGALAGNRSYFDMRGFSWQDVRAALEARSPSLIGSSPPKTSKQSLQILRSCKQPHLTTNRRCGALMSVSPPRRSRYRRTAPYPSQAAMLAPSAVNTRHDIPMSPFSCQRPWLRKFCFAPKRAMLVSYVTKMASFKSMAKEKWISSALRRPRGRNSAVLITDHFQIFANARLNSDPC